MRPITKLLGTPFSKTLMNAVEDFNIRVLQHQNDILAAGSSLSSRLAAEVQQRPYLFLLTFIATWLGISIGLAACTRGVWFIFSYLVSILLGWGTIGTWCFLVSRRPKLKYGASWWMRFLDQWIRELKKPLNWIEQQVNESLLHYDHLRTTIGGVMLFAFAQIWSAFHVTELFPIIMENKWGRLLSQSPSQIIAALACLLILATYFLLIEVPRAWLKNLEVAIKNRKLEE